MQEEIHACPRTMARMVYLWFFYYFLQCCCTQYVPCSVTQDVGRTAYKVQEFWGTQCEYQWANATNHLLVNHVDDPDEVVVNHNNTALTIKGCLDLIHYRRDCISEGKTRIANCTTNCSQSAGLRQTRRGHYCYYLLVPFAALVLVLAAGACFLHYRWKKSPKALPGCEERGTA